MLINANQLSYIHSLDREKSNRYQMENNMGEMLIVVVIVSLSAAILGAIIALWVQRGYFQRLQMQQRGWERAQEGHHQNWENKQEKQIVDVEARLSMKVQHVQK